MASAAVLVELWRAPAPGRPTLSVFFSPLNRLPPPFRRNWLSFHFESSVYVRGRIAPHSYHGIRHFRVRAVCPTPTITLNLFFRAALMKNRDPRTAKRWTKAITPLNDQYVTVLVCTIAFLQTVTYELSRRILVSILDKKYPNLFYKSISR